ncbi:MAG: UbiX family flavin prenyltransferase [Planctomycetes bacterium]|nr:UbiX family flavin prenyltransferase [Planctomycetota bacterium]
MSQGPWVVAVTGASGGIYALRLIDCLLAADQEVALSISRSGAAVLRHETGLDVSLDAFDAHRLWTRPDGRPWWTALHGPFAEGRSVPAEGRGALRYYDHRDFMAPIASGSHRTRGMVICPCSGGTLSGVAHGSCDNLIERAAEVHLKEGRTLVLVPRETPVSRGYLQNLVRAARGGAVVLPAMPAFYQGHASVHDLVDFIIARILDQFSIEHALSRRWGASP